MIYRSRRVRTYNVDFGEGADDNEFIIFVRRTNEREIIIFAFKGEKVIYCPRERGKWLKIRSAGRVCFEYFSGRANVVPCSIGFAEDVALNDAILFYDVTFVFFQRSYNPRMPLTFYANFTHRAVQR